MYIDGNLKIRRAYSLLLPNNTDTKNTELTSNSDYLSIKTSNTRTLANGSAVRIEDAGRNPIFKMNYDGSITNGDLATFINTANIDTTYMKWDSTNKKLKVDTAAVAHLAMPSNTNVKLTLGSSGTTYTAPADGYVCVGFFGNAGGHFEILAQVSNSVNYVTGSARCQCPVLKGGFTCWYENRLIDNNLVFYFNYAIGTVPTNT